MIILYPFQLKCPCPFHLVSLSPIIDISSRLISLCMIDVHLSALHAAYVPRRLPRPDSNVPLAQWWPDFEFPQRATTWATAPSPHGARSSILYWPDVSATALGQHSAPVQARHRFPRLISGPLALGCRTPRG